MDPDHIKVDYGQVRFIAVGACQTSYGNYHTGVAYRNASGRLMFFHQAFHYDTKSQPIEEAHRDVDGPLFCVVPVVEEERARAIAAFWEMIADEGEQIAYALQDDPNALFDPNTGRLALPNGRGLTCSTFVLVLFRSVEFPLIDTTGWPHDRPGDKEAQEDLVRFLERHYPNDREHIEGVRSEIGCYRIRPEEIGGSALYRVLPVRHPEVEAGGLFVRGGLATLRQVTGV
jgi:hypothetical protein